MTTNKVWPLRMDFDDVLSIDPRKLFNVEVVVFVQHVDWLIAPFQISAETEIRGLSVGNARGSKEEWKKRSGSPVYERLKKLLAQ